MSSSPPDLDKLTPKQRALFELLLKEKAAKRAAPVGGIARRAGSGPAPLSFSQQRLWVVDQLEGGTSFAYNVHITVQLTGALEVGLLEKSANEVVRRHESLRTTFGMVDGQPVQLVAAELKLSLPVVDLSALPRDEQPAEVERRATEESQRLFNLATGPLMRVTVLRLAPTEHVVLLTVHHMVVDRWSLGVLVRELMAAYQAYAAGQPPPLPELPIQYADFAVWQRAQVQGEALQAELRHWKQKLGDIPPPLELPTDRPRPSVVTYRGAREFVTLPPALTKALKAVGQPVDATLFMTLLAAFQATLHRYSGQTDFSVGTPIANRKVPELEPLIGFFVNTLVLRGNLEGNPTFVELLKRAKGVCLEAYAHQDLPFEKLVEELQPERDSSRNPLFQVMFSFQNTPRQDLEVPGLSSRYLLVNPGSAKFDVLLELREDRPDEIFGWLEFNTDLFDAATVVRLRHHYLRVLEAVAANPELRVSDLPLLGAEEVAQLAAWNDTQREYPTGTLHGWVEAQVARTPDVVAVTFEGESLTYAQLDARANQLAHLLRGLGVGPEVPVGVRLERSLDLVVALLGILKAGGAYVPLDASYPAERLAAMVEDAGARVVVTPEVLAQAIACPVSPVTVRVDPGSLAYVIFTSGSTGRPKGAMNTHGAVLNRLLWMQEAYGLSASDVVLQKTPFSFDVSVWEFFWPLGTGARLVVAKPGGHQEPTYLAGVIAAEAVTTVHFVPSMLQAFLGEPLRLPTLKRVVCSGEALPLELKEACLAKLPGVGLFNLYGPTEAAVDVTHFSCVPGDARRTVPIGKPVANTQVHLLDRHLQPVPVGVPGELYIGGVQVGRGYLGKPALTADRFVPSPFGPTGARLYRTGDLARYLPDGEVEYLGRVDFQVKLRGFRIELGEIESALLAHAEVREALVLAREDGPGGKRLVAYVTGRGPLDVAALRDSLRARLPEYMVPSAIVVLDALPLSPNGKVDRRALPAPTLDGGSAEGYVAPRTPTEQLMAGIWARVLQRESIGAREDFFALGGHSLLGTQVMARIREVFQVDLPLRRLFDQPTIAGLSALVDGATRKSLAPPMVRVDRDGPLPLSYGQQRLWLLDQIGPGSPAYNIAAVVELAGALDADALARALSALVERHESLRTTLRTEHGTPRQVIASPAPLEIARVDLRAEPDPEAAARRLAAEESLRPFDLSKGPLLRASLLRLNDTRQVLLLTVHHIVSDGWSIKRMVRELVALYQGQPLPAPALQYADHAAWQRAWVKGDVLDAEVGWWREQLADAPGALELPTDFARPAVQTFRGASVPVRLSKTLTDKVRALSRSEGVTPFMVLLAAYQTLLARYSGQQDVVVGSPIAGRSRAETEEMVGFFVNTLALRTRFDGAPSFVQVLQRVRETALGAYGHQEAPFEKVVEALSAARDLSRPPVFQAFFALQDAPLAPLQVDGLGIRSLDWGQQTAKFEVELSLEETVEGYAGVLIYNRELLTEASAARLATHYLSLLEAALARPSVPVARLPLLLADERAQVLHAWNETAVEYDAESTVVEVFERWATAQPEAIALQTDAGTVTYAELDARANRLARVLVKRGVSADALVGLCVERGVELVVALLGVLKAGGAYVPLDASYPHERLAAMVEDARPRVVVTTAELRSQLPLEDIDCVLLSPTLGAEESSAPLRLAVGPRNLAYVDFTSGSTGRPKGVCIEHRSVLRLVQGAQYARLAKDETFLLIAPISFDASTLEIWGALLNGARLVLYPPESVADVVALGAFLKRHQVTTLHLTAGLFTQMVEGQLEGLSGLRQLLTGGDVVSAPHVRKVLETLQIPVTACYGPTESTTFASCHRMTEAAQVGTAVPIGTPISNTQVYVLDGELQPVPQGVVGELYVGGDGLARGYLARADFTAERFLPNPFASSGARLYRTGDLARHRADGVLEFLGRADTQVKIRGYRVELSEVEAGLLKHPVVKEALVLALPDGAGGKRLVGYVVAPDSLDVSTVKDFLRQHLPDFMVPAVLMRLDAFPLTPNAKVDRKALPLPDAAASAGVTYVAPRTPTEEQLAALWSELLNVSRVGAEDSFFTLGGHSLLATQLVSRIRATFNVELPLRDAFEAPVLSALAERIDQHAATAQRPIEPPIVPVERGGPLALSYSQQRLWVLDQLEPASPAYNIAAVVELDGALDEERLSNALSALLARHESLRTSFRETIDGPVQVIEAPRALPLLSIDLRAEADPEAAARKQARTESLRPFDLTAGPLLRATLLRLSAARRVLLLTVHHIVSDAWSTGVLVRELTALYVGAPLPERKLQYADYSTWQRSWMRGEVLDRHLGWWREQLADAPHALELPTDFPRPPVQSFHGGGVEFALSPKLVEAIRTLGQRSNATPFMVLLAVYQTLLARYSRQDDVLVGSPIAGRSRAETEEMIGFFVNTLVLRARFDEQLTFTGLLEQVRDMAVGAFGHQGVPFEKVVEALQPARDLSRPPVFQAFFALQNAPVTAAEVQGLTVRPVDWGQQTAKFEVELSFNERPDGFTGFLIFNRALLRDQTAARMVKHYLTLLETLVAAPEKRVKQVPLLLAEERAQVLHTWNQTAVEYDAASTVVDVFERQVAAQPEAIALQTDAGTVTYGELDARANRLARVLVKRGVSADALVGLCVERGVDLMVALLGVLKAGGAYVPLDASYPRERLAAMVEDARPRVVVTTAELQRQLPLEGIDCVLLSPTLGAEESSAPLRLAVGPRNLAYVDFTSGSTGRPKGVCIEHRSVLRLVQGARYARLAKDETFLLIAPISFDASTLEVWGALLNGARLVLYPPESVADVVALGAFLKRHRVTTLHLTAGLFTQMVEGQLEGLSGLRQLLTGGDVVSAPHVRKVLETLHIPVTACYGPTESTTFASCHRMTDVAQVGTAVPIGTPISNTQVYVLDGQLQPVPQGVVGELYVGGDGLARGYLGRADFTAERFLPNPFASSGARLYRTGDLARHRADGVLEFLGRADTQVKIRGYRVELSEVEAGLVKHPQVNEALVLALPDGTGGKRLVGYVVAPDSLDVSTVKDFLRQHLPDFMVPAVLMRLDAFPLTANAKVDRKALPLPDAAASQGTPYVAPRTPTEEQLAALWSELLNVSRVGTEDSFFTLGGHSLLATQLVSRIRAAFNVELPLRDAFEATTLAALAERIDQRTSSSPSSAPITRVASAATAEDLNVLSDDELDALLAATNTEDLT